MTIQHVDRTGHPWTFEMNCTPIQGQMVQRLLSSVRCIGNREELNLSYLAEWEDNTAFRDDMEHVVLSALRDWGGTTHRRPADTSTPARVSETVNTNPVTVSGTVNTNDADDEREPYYWENF